MRFCFGSVRVSPGRVDVTLTDCLSAVVQTSGPCCCCCCFPNWLSSPRHPRGPWSQARLTWRVLPRVLPFDGAAIFDPPSPAYLLGCVMSRTLRPTPLSPTGRCSSRRGFSCSGPSRCTRRSRCEIWRGERGCTTPWCDISYIHAHVSFFRWEFPISC